MKENSRFSAWQEANQARREVIIDEYLVYLDQTRVQVRHATDLANLVARHIAQVEGSPCNKATLMRNIRYKAKILSYQAQHLTPGVSSIEPRGLDSGSKALVASAKLEAGNLKRESERLNVYIRTLENQVAEYRERSINVEQKNASCETATGKLNQISDYEFKFIRTCQSLRILLSYLCVVLEVDIEAQSILDKSKRRNNVIVDKELAGPFVEWLKLL